MSGGGASRQRERQVQRSWGRSVLGEFEEQRGGECGRRGEEKGRVVGEPLRRKESQLSGFHPSP